MSDPFFPGETEHFRRLLDTVSFLAQRGRLCDAAEVLELADAAAGPEDRQELCAVAAALLSRIRQAQRSSPAPPSPPGKVLRFRARRASTPLAAASMSSGFST
jgi:hypothetical protein